MMGMRFWLTALYRERMLMRPKWRRQGLLSVRIDGIKIMGNGERVCGFVNTRGRLLKL